MHTRFLGGRQRQAERLVFLASHLINLSLSLSLCSLLHPHYTRARGCARGCAQTHKHTYTHIHKHTHSSQTGIFQSFLPDIFSLPQGLCTCWCLSGCVLSSSFIWLTLAHPTHSVQVLFQQERKNLSFLLQPSSTVYWSSVGISSPALHRVVLLHLFKSFCDLCIFFHSPKYHENKTWVDFRLSLNLYSVNVCFHECFHEHRVVGEER